MIVFFQKANQYRELDGMGTTIVVAVVIGSELLIATSVIAVLICIAIIK